MKLVHGVRRALGISAVIQRLSVVEARTRGLPTDLDTQIDQLRRAMGRIEARQSAGNASCALSDHEFQVYSQWGEDGIIQFLIRHVPVAQPVFVEFGVQDYREANTRFLLQENNWSGLVLDSSAADVESIREQGFYWRYNLRAECSFITRENIDSVLTGNGVTGEIGLLSIDIDGNDYWVWDAISAIKPAIVVCEYNSLWGAQLAVTIPYRPDFDRFSAHYSGLYAGASLPALCEVGRRKGYALVGSNSAGNNAFFVRRELLGPLKPLSAADAYVSSQFREARNESGIMTHPDPRTVLPHLRSLPLLDVLTSEEITVGDLYSSSH